MDIKKDLTAHIKSLGKEAAAEFYGKKLSTITTWLKSEQYPADAIQLYYNSVDATQPSVPDQVPVEQQPDNLTVEQRLERIEQYLTNLDAYNNSIATQPSVVQQQPNFQQPTAAWYPAGPEDSNASGFVRPAAGAITKASFATPAPAQQPGLRAVQPAGLPPGTKPADTWMTPIVKKP